MHWGSFCCDKTYLCTGVVFGELACPNGGDRDIGGGSLAAGTGVCEEVGQREAATHRRADDHRPGI